MYSVFGVRRTEEHWRQEKGLVLFTWNVLNPNGPTINCVGIRDSGRDGEAEVFYRWMHFLGGESYVLGFVETSDAHYWETLIEVLRYAFGNPGLPALKRFPLITCVPSFVTIQDTPIRPYVCELISSAQAFQVADWGRDMYYLKKYGSDFFGRAAEETREALENIKQDPDLVPESREFLKMTEVRRSRLPDFAGWKPNQYESKPIDKLDVDTWWQTITNDKFERSCVFQLAQAWVGAIHQFQFPGNDRVISEPFESARDFLSQFNHPLWGEDWSSEKLRESMGLTSAS